VSSTLGPLLSAAIVFPILCLTRQGALEDPSGFVPEAKMLFGYLAFFAFGWLLYRNQAFPRLGRAACFVGFGLATALLGFYFIWRSEQPDSPQTLVWLFGSAWFLGLSMWLFTFGFTGMCFRLLERPRPWVRYVSDSSYWLYLAHMPVLLVFQIAVAGTGWPPVLKALVVLAASVPALLASYHLFVRFTWIGVILNGRRHAIKRRPPLGAAVESGRP
jgi:peptidoglycan/LPS O-acetylase OafA/YrhL